jgi:hypothetical protein
VELRQTFGGEQETGEEGETNEAKRVMSDEEAASEQVPQIHVEDEEPESKSTKQDDPTKADANGNLKVETSGEKASQTDIDPSLQYFSNRLRWKCNPTKGDQLKQKVLTQLQLTTSLKPGEGKAVEAFYVCPALTTVSNSWYIKEAVREFFGLEDVEPCKGHGFVRGSGGRTFFHWEGTKDPKDLTDVVELLPSRYGWEACNGVLADGEAFDRRLTPFEFCYFGGKWEVFGQGSWRGGSRLTSGAFVVRSV